MLSIIIQLHTFTRMNLFNSLNYLLKSTWGNRASEMLIIHPQLCTLQVVEHSNKDLSESKAHDQQVMSMCRNP